jgi:hypothetical protein
MKDTNLIINLSIQKLHMINKIWFISDADISIKNNFTYSNVYSIKKTYYDTK